ncbi:MAG: phosphoribosylformylglycinamidine synthase [Tidjanibacter sp.]|nr:phosphoribosylformylglycinamidine synthase [Tidjanibacter sp.]
MKNYRIFVEKRASFRVEAESLREELNANLGLNIADLRYLNVYDLFGFTPELLEQCRYRVFGERPTDTVVDSLSTEGIPHIAVEFLPGQFDQRAASAEDCVRLIEPSAEVKIRSSKLYIFDSGVDAATLGRIEHYIINAVEARPKDLSVLSPMESAEVKPVATLDGFRRLADREEFCRQMGLAMNADDLATVIDYFQKEGRDPNETELRILDTYWSDHCRHTTFTSELTEITVDDSFIASELNECLDLWHSIRHELGRERKSLCLMDLATIGARYLHKKGVLDDLEQSEENNACSIYVNVDVDGEVERWLLQFKNETHNHPTEIEPFGGASTCLGGAIRDPLSGRSYVYQAMRVTGAGNIYATMDETIEGKLPQRVISLKAASGYSSYGNQIGLATTCVREIYHPSYVAKRLEVGAVVGAVRARDVRRESPEAGDVVLLLGGRTGRDGIGGATGSSKEHNAHSIEVCGSEVQKGNAPEERKLERLFRRNEVTRLIKKSNDFGAGGVSVAIGELADGLDIALDRVPTKYSGLNTTELAISESQERMAVVVEAADREAFERYCHEENVEVTHVADVTDSGRMRMFFGGEKVVDLSREFIDSAGARHFAKAEIGRVEERNPFRREIEGTTIADKVLSNLTDHNVTSQKGLIEMFDSTIGRSTVLMPFGGRTCSTEAQVSVQRLPVGNHLTHTASIMAFGFNPYIMEWSPFHGAAYSVVEAVAKAVAAGAEYDRMRFSFQEYFEKMTSSHAWGKPLAALLGALKMQVELGLPSIGGKDSMSGTFGNITVPPTMIAFGVTTIKDRFVISPEFKSAGNNIYIVRHTPLKNRMPDCEQLIDNFTFVNRMIHRGSVRAAWALGFGGAAEALSKMTFGNEIGAEVNVDEKKLFDLGYGSIIVESTDEFDFPNVDYIGRTTDDGRLTINCSSVTIDAMKQAVRQPFTTVYPDRSGVKGCVENASSKPNTTFYSGNPVDSPVVVLPVFPGTNCDYDVAKAFQQAGAECRTVVFRNLSEQDILESIADLVKALDSSHILALSGGFSAGDEPDGSGKFIANVLLNSEVMAAVNRLIDREGLVLGICNGFQALVKSGLLPDGRPNTPKESSPTLFRNDINRHISQIVRTRVASVASPWLAGFHLGEIHSVAASHGEGKFMVDDATASRLYASGQIAFQYVDAADNATMQSPENPNGSAFAIEGICSPDGRILGKMGHSERYEEGLMKNIQGNKEQDIFRNAVDYFRKKVR